MKREKLVRIAVYILILILLLVLLVGTFFPGILFAWRDYGKTGSEKCKVPAGYSESEWKEHMGHHPDIYKECLT